MKTMGYISTRGGTAPIGFRDAAMTGMARDGGLLIPERLPPMEARCEAWAALTYSELAFEVMQPFVDLPDDDLRLLLRESCATFRHPEVTPVSQAGPVFLLELFHGPTLAFKDVALQFLGRLFAYCLERGGGELNILAATSGDTGSAAIHGVRGRPHIRIFVLYPKGRISPLQERQMTSVPDANVFPIAVEGTFDDCQRIMKSIFSDTAFRDRLSLGAVNSVNWARILSQMVYYVYAALRVRRETGAARVQFAVPTGNFGDILAGYYTAQMGLPVSRLILATNENDILARFFSTGEYGLGPVVPTLSPSMDIQVASNFERYLYARLGRDPARVRGAMAEFARAGRLRLPRAPGAPVDPLFAAGRSDTAATLATIRRYWEAHGVLLDPHTAVGVAVAERLRERDEPVICLATAHPAKFPDAIRQAIGRDLARHDVLERLAGAPTRGDTLPADERTVRDYLGQRIPARA